MGDRRWEIGIFVDVNVKVDGWFKTNFKLKLK